ncbi:Alpha/Beta hydrolase protein [Mycena vitilis]|nr:Alpha/Beta hydrolase protein [Mycena vitilis]
MDSRACVSWPATQAPLLPAREIPSTLSASLLSWWAGGAGRPQTARAPQLTKSRLFIRLPFFRAQSLAQNNSPVVASSSLVDLDKPKHFLKTLAIKSTKPAPDGPPPVVLLPGYGAGIGFFFFNNLSALAQWAGNRGSSVYAVDWLGMGRSARVPFTIKSPRKDIPGVAEAESFFFDSLEASICHSLGGYLSVVYALKYLERVNKIILLSPASVPRDPNQTTAPKRELDPPPPGASSSVEPATHQKVDEIRAEQAAVKPPQSRTRRLFITFFWAPMLIDKHSARRFAGLSEEETRDMHDYILHITLAKGSGEYCISHILCTRAWPIVDPIAALKIPITFGGEQSVENLRKAGNGQARSYIVNAGHHVYLDNPMAVNDLMLKELNRPPPAVRPRRQHKRAHLEDRLDAHEHVLLGVVHPVPRAPQANDTLHLVRPDHLVDSRVAPNGG